MLSSRVDLRDVMAELPQLETPRLLLRVPRLADLDRMADMMRDEETARYIGGTMARSMVWRSLMSMIGAWHETGVAMFSVVRKDTGQWIGRIGPGAPMDGPATRWAGACIAMPGAMATRWRPLRPVCTMPMTCSVGTR